METQRNGRHGKEGGNGGGVGWPIIGLKVLALVFTLTAAVILAVDKQTKTIPISISPDLPPFYVAVPAKSHYLSAFVFCVVSNSIVCAFTAISIAIALATKGTTKGASILMVMVIDVMSLALLFAGIGAGGAVGILGHNGNTHLQWHKVCNVYTKFCHQVAASLFLSFLGGVTNFLVIILSTSKLLRS